MAESGDARVDWPHFRLITYSATTGIPHGWDAELLEKGTPKGLVCEAAHELTLLEDPDSGPLVCFGISGLYGRLCLDPRTNQVVDISYGAFRPHQVQPEVVGPAHPVGSSLDQFIAMVRAATERFPFDSDLTVQEREDEDARDERRFSEWARAVLELDATLRHIDPEVVADPGGFWMTFLADVGMGNYGSEEFFRKPEE